MGGCAVVTDRCVGIWEGVSPRPSALPLGELEADDVGAVFVGEKKKVMLEQQRN